LGQPGSDPTQSVPAPSDHATGRTASAVPSNGPDNGYGAEAVTLPPSTMMPPLAASCEHWPTVPGYEIRGELGRGRMGVVYLAEQTQLHRLVALKMILHAGHASAADVDRFRTEAEAVARLQHPHIVQIHEIGEADGCPFFSLEYCSGGS
jgi:eukaryotic-like serine/threonine-protein kinase